MRRAIAAVLVLLLLPFASAQGPSEDPDESGNPTRMVTFYPHVFGVGSGSPMPGNTQFPVGEDDFSRGTYIPCSNTLGATPALAHCEELGINTLYIYSTAGFVHADMDSWSYEDFHNERGQAKDVLLDITQDITATFYMSADAHPWIPSTLIPERIAPGVPTGMFVWNWDPGVHPDWQVEASLFLMSLGEYQGQASDPPPVREVLDSGEATLVAQGLTTPATMISLDSNLNGGQGEVYEFEVNLGKAQVDRIPRELDWVLRFRWWSHTGDQTYIAPTSWNVNSGEFYPIRFTMPVKNPFDVELVYPQFLHDKLLIHAMLNSPWGSYDVDSKTVGIEITGDTAGPVTMGRVNRVADFSVAHGGHYKPVNITWVWDYRADNLRPGLYTVKVTASNFQHSATSTTEAQFRIHNDGTGSVVSIGRSGQATFTEGQLQSLPQGTQSQGLSVQQAPTEARNTPGPELLLLLAGVALLAARRP